jgi:hypothetical protein
MGMCDNLMHLGGLGAGLGSGTLLETGDTLPQHQGVVNLACNFVV